MSDTISGGLCSRLTRQSPSISKRAHFGGDWKPETLLKIWLTRYRHIRVFWQVLWYPGLYIETQHQSTFSCYNICASPCSDPSTGKKVANK